MRPVPVAAAHFWVPWCLRWGARGRTGRNLAQPDRALLVYDGAAVLLAGLALARGAAGRRLLTASLAGVLGARSGRETALARTVLVAVAEEILWRPLGMRAVVPFALMHRPVSGRAWPYHLVTGTMLATLYRMGGLPPAAAGHCLHNIALASSRSALRPGVLRAPERGTCAKDANGAPAFVASDAWPVSAAADPAAWPRERPKPDR